MNLSYIGVNLTFVVVQPNILCSMTLACIKVGIKLSP